MACGIIGFVKHKWMWAGFLIGLAIVFLASFVFHIPW
jgi:hypothetical protein